VGTARLLNDGHFGRIAVLKEHRRQGGAESKEVIENILQCVDSKPNYVITSPVFFKLKRYTGTFNEFRKRMLTLLNNKFTCTEAANWTNAKICIRNQI
jgi:hypothetical protein